MVFATHKKRSGPGLPWIAWLLGFAIYVMVIDAPFVFDDVLFIKQNPVLHDPSAPLEIWLFNPARFLSNYSFALNHGMHGLNTSGYHLFNVLCHLVAITLVWLLIWRFLSLAPGPSFPVKNHGAIALFGASIFAVHPIQTQAVSYIWQRSMLMASCFYLGGLFFYLLWRESVVRGQPLFRPWLLSLLCGLAAMFCKEIAFTFPLAIFLVEWLLFPNAARPKAWRFLPFGALLLVVPATVLLSMEQYDAMLDSGKASMAPMVYILTQARVTVNYLQLLILPYGQNIDHDPPLSGSFFEPVVIMSSFVLFFVAASGFLLLRRHRLLAFGVFWFFIALSVEALAFTLPDVMFEHRLYLAMFGFAVFLAVAWARIAAKFSLPYFPLAAGLVLLLFVLSLNRNLIWRSPLQLWDDAVSKSPNKARPLLNRGIALRDMGRGAEALRDFDRTLSLEPNNTLALVARGLYHQIRKDYDQALADYSQALLQTPENAVFWQNRGAIYLEKGQFREAISDLTQAILLDNEYAFAYKNRGFAYQALGLNEKAVAEFDRAIELDARYAEAYFSRGISLERLGQLDRARIDYETALKHNANLKQAHLNLGVILHRQGHTARAKRHFETALRIDPRFIEAYVNRGSLAFEDGVYSLAEADFTAAIKLAPSGDLYYRRGVSYLKMGDLNRAAADLDKASQLGRQTPESVKALLRGLNQVP